MSTPPITESKQCPNCDRNFGLEHSTCPHCGTGSPSQHDRIQRDSFPKWVIALLIFVIPLGSCGACLLTNQNVVENGYRFSDVLIVVEVVSVIVGLLMINANFNREFR